MATVVAGMAENERERVREREKRPKATDDEGKQPPNRGSELPDLLAIDPNLSGRNMAEQQSQYNRLYEVPPVAVDRNRDGSDGGIFGGICWGVLQKYFSHVPLHVGHVLHPGRSNRLRCFRLCSHG